MQKEKRLKKQSGKMLTKQLCINAVLIALFVVLDLYALKIGNNMKVTFSGLPIIIASIYYGPVQGLAVGLIGAFIGQLVQYGIGITTFLWIIPAGIRGLIVGLFAVCLKKYDILYEIKATTVFEIPKKNGEVRNVTWRNSIYPILTVVIIISSLIVTLSNTIIMYPASKIDGYYHETLITATLVWRFISSVITAVLYSIIVPLLLKPLNKAIGR